MKNIDNKSEVTLIRRKAESMREKIQSISSSDGDLQKLAHELNVHQIELELQNQELMQAKSEAQEALDNYTELYDSEQSGSFTLTKDGEIKRLNLAGAKMLGKERSRLKNNQFGFFLTKESLPAFNTFLNKIFKGNDKESCEVTLITKSDLPLYAHLTGIATPDGKQCHITAVDITSQKESVEELADSEIRYRRLFEAAQDGVLILDEETGMIVDVNPYLMKMMDYTKEEFLNKAIWEIGFFKDIAANKEKFKELQRQKYVHYEDLPLKREDGQEFHVEFVSNVYLVNKEKVIQCNIRDITKRKQIEEAMIVLETRYQRLFETAKDGILILDADTGKIIDLNPFMIDLLGYSKEHFSGKAIWQIGFFKDIAENKEKYLELPKKKYIRYDDLPLKRADGRQINVEFVSNVYLMNNQKVIQCNIRDITERKKVENEAIKTSRVIAVNSQINHAIINTREKNLLFEKTCNICVNVGEFRMAWIGMFDEAEKLVKPIAWDGAEEGFLTKMKKLPNYEINAVKSITERAIKEGKRVVCNDITAYPPNSDEKWRDEALKRGYRSAVSLPIKVNKKVIGALSLYAGKPDYFNQEEIRLLTDVTSNISFAIESIDNETGRRQVEKELKNYRLKLEETVEKRTTALITANKELSFQNEEKVKHAAELSIANKELDFQNKEKEKRAEDLIIANKELAFQNKEKDKRAEELVIADKELRFQNKEKEKRAAELLIANKELSFQNEEKEKRAEELIIANKELAFQNDEKEKRATELTNANKELAQFAYLASHDLQEPLRTLSTYTQLLAQYNDKFDNKGQQFIHFITESALRMNALINDLLTYSRIGTSSKTFSQVNFNMVFSKVILKYAIAIKEKNASITAYTLPSVWGNEVQLIQLLQNLAWNALKFCNTTPIVHISAKEESDHFLFSIKDNGIGIEPQYADKIFLIFQRLVNRHEYSGTGIGLAVCKRIVERHGGKIWFESKVGEGTTFYFTIAKNMSISESDSQSPL